VNWNECRKVGLALLLSPIVGFILSALLLLVLKVFFRSKRLYEPPQGDDRPPAAIRGVLIATCGGVSFAHGSNDGQKGMGLLLLVLIGFMPIHYALTVNKPDSAPEVYKAAGDTREAFAKAGVEPSKKLAENLKKVEDELKGIANFEDLPRDKDNRWDVRQSVMAVAKELKTAAADEKLPQETRDALAKLRKDKFLPTVEYVPLWVVIGTAFALGVGTTIGYKRIVVTVAEKIGKQHLTYAQGAAAETVAAGVILLTAITGFSVSTTHVLNSGVAGTMVANKSGLQWKTVTKILTAWVFTLPSCMLLAGLLFWIGRTISG
jgi:phosphate/sulfate permease